MDYTTFKMNLTELLLKEFSEDIEITCEKIPKNNGIFLEGLIINRKNRRAAPVVYVEEYYQLFQKGVPMEQLVKKILWNYTNCEVQIEFTGEFFKEYEPVKEHIFYKLVNYEKNRIHLEKMPHKKILDLAMVFYYQVENNNSTASIMIQNSHLRMWDISEDELEENAMKYTCEEKEAEFLTMAQIAGMEEEEMEELTGRDEFPMYVLTNRQRFLGAGTILYPGILEKAEELLGDDFFILPSSIHECILIPLNGNYGKDELTEMVTEINRDHVEPDEILADQVYYYLAEDGQIHM